MKKKDVKAGTGCLAMFLSSIVLVKLLMWAVQPETDFGTWLLVLISAAAPWVIVFLWDLRK